MTNANAVRTRDLLLTGALLALGACGPTKVQLSCEAPLGAYSVTIADDQATIRNSDGWSVVTTEHYFTITDPTNPESQLVIDRLTGRGDWRLGGAVTAVTCKPAKPL